MKCFLLISFILSTIISFAQKDTLSNSGTIKIKKDNSFFIDPYMIDATFSPNGDGANDYFYIKRNDLESVVVEIYDIEEELIYKWEGIEGKWDGKNSNKEDVQEGNYYYCYEAIDNKGLKFRKEGFVRLIR